MHLDSVRTVGREADSTTASCEMGAQRSDARVSSARAGIRAITNLRNTWPTEMGFGHSCSAFVSANFAIESIRIQFRRRSLNGSRNSHGRHPRAKVSCLFLGQRLLQYTGAIKKNLGLLRSHIGE